MYISTDEELSAFCERARAFEAVAVDTEFLREKTYHSRLCLVQVATPEETVAIDPLAIRDKAPLADLLADPSTIKVFHACTQDMEVLLQSLGVLPAPIFDTQVAAAFLGERQQISYNGLVHAFCGVTLPKSESLTDWSRRPLTEKQLEYALDDVRYTYRPITSWLGACKPRDAFPGFSTSCGRWRTVRITRSTSAKPIKR